ncbi:hypothetical protein DMN91_012291 [Ooceraea biroi]|uniref:Uncharacterized protein n=1 Tax=Ooceraea biroi TaxID=2015173 RepID=A0A3L8D465_OOCBI|nr:hypothetical protein DMN91_012291 [Ooceraea biroi]
MMEQSPPKPATLDTRALAEASRNLTQKLKQLSSEVLTSRVDLAEDLSLRDNSTLFGIERERETQTRRDNREHASPREGVYSGTFSGTLNPALQDRHGRPKRDISTIIHILNDLLCATPAASAGHYRHHHHRHSHARQQSSSMSTISAGTTTTGKWLHYIDRLPRFRTRDTPTV